MPIGRTPWIDDDGTGESGTILNNAEKQALYNEIDAACAFVNQVNVFQGSQTIQTPYPHLTFMDPAGPANGKNFNLIVGGGQFIIQILADDLSAPIAVPLLLDATGAKIQGPVTERNRSTPMGDLIDVPFNAGAFAALGGTASVSQVANSFTLIGKLCIWTVHLSVTFAGAVSPFRAYLPGGATCARHATGQCTYGGGVGGAFIAAGANALDFFPTGFGGSFAPQTTPFGWTLPFFIQ